MTEALVNVLAWGEPSGTGKVGGGGKLNKRETEAVPTTRDWGSKRQHGEENR